MKIQMIMYCAALLILAGCSNSDNDEPMGVEEGTGQFIDSAVDGLEYQSGSIRGLTSTDGSFQFEQGATIQFFIGDIVLGEGQPADIMSPLDIVGTTTDVTNEYVLNIARFLQTLDTDNDPNNGISVSAFMRTQAADKVIDFNVTAAEFAANGNVQTIIAELTASNDDGPQSLVSAQDAEAHLRDSLGLEPMIPPGLTLEELQEVCNPVVVPVITGPFEPGQILVGFDPSTSLAEINTLVAAFGLSRKTTFDFTTLKPSKIVFVPNGAERQWIATFKSLCVVDYASPNYIVSLIDPIIGGPIGGGGGIW